jgi:hypothetical protein
VSFLRHHFVVLIVALLVLGGYTRQVLARCHEPTQQFAKRTGDREKGPSEKKSDSECQCLCHKIFSNVSAVPARSPVLVLVLQVVRLPAGEFPPDTEPQGIDYPPQLA